jgi:hypothetical protein
MTGSGKIAMENTIIINLAAYQDKEHQKNSFSKTDKFLA